MESFKLRCALVGHEKDVRGVCGNNFPENSIISGSRDITTRIWIPNSENEGFIEGNVMGGHARFVSCVCVTPPDTMYPQGLIMTGSNDHMIFAYTLDSPQPVFKLEGHSDTVCSLASGKFGSLISGSWDTTAKVWLNKKCVMTLQGHEAAVWAVAIMPEGGFMLSASADKLIKLWKAGKCERTFRGHTDCVRGLVVLNVNEFLSCSNDATIRRWSVSTGDCLQTYYGHSNFIYSIATFPQSEDFVTTSEDRSLKIWRGGECKQTIHHPCVSVWCVCVLQNGDIVTGGSDGIVRVFTCAPERMADEEMQKAYEEQISTSAIPAQIGDLKTEELPPASALLNPGKRDGQTMMVRNDDQIEAHVWKAAEGKWEKIGNVVGGAGGTQASSGKQLYQGKEYDYVFDVELDVDGVPTKMKLPYNAGGDPWLAAHNFLEVNNISQMYLDQVANFIMDQTKGMTIDQAAPSVSDPFTGGGRYIPGTDSSRPASGPMTDPLTGGGRYIPGTDTSRPRSGPMTDPLTGGGRYVPGDSAPAAANDSDPLKVTFVKGAKNNFFPQTAYLLFEASNATAIIGKLKEFRSSADANVEESSLDQLAQLITGEQISANQLSTLWAVLQWPKEHVFPGLDVLRLSIRHAAVNEHFCNAKDGAQFMQLLLSHVTPDGPPANTMLALRTLANVGCQSSGETLMRNSRESVVASIVATVAKSPNKNIQIAAATVMLNFAVAYRKQEDIEAQSQLILASGEMSSTITDPEAHFRLLVALGTLLHGDANAIELAKSMQMSLYTTKCAAIFEPKKVCECAEYLAKLL